MCIQLSEQNLGRICGPKRTIALSRQGLQTLGPRYNMRWLGCRRKGGPHVIPCARDLQALAPKSKCPRRPTNGLPYDIGALEWSHSTIQATDFLVWLVVGLTAFRGEADQIAMPKETGSVMKKKVVSCHIVAPRWEAKAKIKIMSLLALSITGINHSWCPR